MPVRSVGVEEEFLLVDPQSAAPRAVASTVLRAGDDLDGDLTNELHAEQLETGTSPRTGLDEIRREIVDRRREAATAARRAGVAAVPLATFPLPVDPHVNDGPRYRAMLAPLRSHRRRAAHLRLPRPRRGRVGRRSRRRGRPPAAVAARAAGAHRQLTVLGRARQRVRQLPQPGVGSLAVGRADRPVRLGGRVPPVHRGAPAHGDRARPRHALLRRPAVAPPPDGRGARRRRLPRPARHAPARRPHPRAGRDRGPRVGGRAAAHPGPARGAAPRRVAGRPVRDRRHPAPAPRLAPATGRRRGGRADRVRRARPRRRGRPRHRRRAVARPAQPQAGRAPPTPRLPRPRPAKASSTTPSRRPSVRTPPAGPP